MVSKPGSSEPGSSEPELFFKKKKCEAVKCSPCLSVFTVRPDGDSPWKQRCMERFSNPASNRLVQEVFSHSVSKWCPRRWRLEDMKQGGAFEYEKQDGGHELKEKEVGDDPDSQIQQMSWPVSQNAKGINLVPCCSQEVFFAHHLSKKRGRLEPLCGAMGRYLCVKAGLRSACHELAVGIQMSNLKSQSSRPVSSLSLQGNDKMKPVANILWRSPQPAPKRVDRML
ncbi:hypothetical protein F2Q70_00002215 [Brassica cretica]|uniref:Uncharacterized protein n=1 Tax=Brassica cretica TaxID=69181 RepID=A0A8S9IU67_BRACR|nr:hypothetical protein F2Q70_00002215 [Brassica cretica]